MCLALRFREWIWVRGVAEYLLVVGLLVIHKTILYLWYMISGLYASDL